MTSEFVRVLPYITKKLVVLAASLCVLCVRARFYVERENNLHCGRQGWSSVPPNKHCTISPRKKQVERKYSFEWYFKYSAWQVALSALALFAQVTGLDLLLDFVIDLGMVEVLG